MVKEPKTQKPRAPNHLTANCRLRIWIWAVQAFRPEGEAYLIRFADDFVCAFRYKDDAEWFYEELGKRLTKFKLELA